jgi:hypothetical protein
MLAERPTIAAERGFAFWWWRERASGDLIGQVGLNPTEVEGEQVVEAGWSISSGRWVRTGDRAGVARLGFRGRRAADRLRQAQPCGMESG